MNLTVLDLDVGGICVEKLKKKFQSIHEEQVACTT